MTSSTECFSFSVSQSLSWSVCLFLQIVNIFMSVNDISMFFLGCCRFTFSRVLCICYMQLSNIYYWIGLVLRWITKFYSHKLVMYFAFSSSWYSDFRRVSFKFEWIMASDSLCAKYYQHSITQNQFSSYPAHDFLSSPLSIFWHIIRMTWWKIKPF